MTTPTKEQAALLSYLEDGANILLKIQTNLKKCPKARLTEGYIRARIQGIEECWSKFNQDHLTLTKCTPREQRGVLPYFLNEDYFTYEELHICLKADLLDILNKKSTSQNIDRDSTNTENSSIMVKLPRIQLPSFSGKYEEFPTYKDLFTSLVHENTSLSCVQKLHYLKSSLLGEAESLLRHIHITENNYNQAWELLISRYGNKRIIITSLLKRLFYQKKINTQSAAVLKSLLDTTSECLNSLFNMKIQIDQWDPMIVFLVVQKLDIQTHKEWEEHAYNEEVDELPTWDKLKRFLEAKFRTLELVTPTTWRTTTERDRTQRTFHITERQENHNSSSASTTQAACAFCNGNHYVFNCKEFVKQPVEERYKFVQRSNLCFNCLIPNHSVFRCKRRTSCRICNRKHHSLIHQDTQAAMSGKHTVADTTTSNTNEDQETIVKTHYSRQREAEGQNILLATALVNVVSNYGEPQTCRALIDQGSEASFVTNKVVDLLKLKKTEIRGRVSGVGKEEVLIKYKVNVSIVTKSKKIIQVEAYLMNNISSQLPTKEINIDLPELRKLTLADPTFGRPGKINILLGAAVFAQIIEEGLVRIQDHLVAQKTDLGWILSGQTRETMSKQFKFTSLFVTIQEDNELLRKFWEIETTAYTKKRFFTKEEKECETIYKNTTTREENGRYIVQLPLKQSIEDTIRSVGTTKEQAIVRFKQLENKFKRNNKLREEYTKVVNEYIELGHMKKADHLNEHNSIYLPHHAVIREDKDTTKVRIVFDASAKGTSGQSLNENMMIGPVLQPDLRSLITRWRIHKVCVVGDIIKMYRMINMNRNYTNLQQIVWRNTENEDIETYQLTTVTFGTAAAPYLAVRTLIQLAEDEAGDYPEASAAIKQSFYMDDLMIGHHDIEHTKRLCHGINKILKKGGFELQKWSSNSKEVLKFLKGNEGKTADKIDIKLDNIIKILGLSWNRKEDTFKVTVNLPEQKLPVTKRSILSDVARLFDPFGWLSPVVIRAKIMIQKLWLCNLTWDEELPLDLTADWTRYREALVELETIEVPRWLCMSPKCKSIEIHGFSDASTTSYAAVTYLKVMDENDTVHVTIIASRTKVAPLKQLTVPRLELCGAALLATLIEDLQEVLEVPKNNIFAYTDSMVVLSWLQSHPSRWLTFVGNRVAEIQRILNNNQWRYIPTEDNPADIPSRGVEAGELKELKKWWRGPSWLHSKETKQQTYHIPTTNIEIKKSFHIQTQEEEQPIWERFSTISRMKRVLAHCRRLLNRNEKGRETYLTYHEMELILLKCVKWYQNKIYGREVEEIQKDGKVRKKSTLITLSPFLDKNGVLKVGGRLENAAVPEIFKHPIIIPRDQHITKLIINEAHTRTFHGGIQMMMAYIRSNYWVIGLKSAVRKHIHTCKICIIDKAKVKNQLMGQLPSVRVRPHRAFLNSGVDYAGPVQMRISKGRGCHTTKGYICLFVCMATRAIHLEAVTDLTSQGFIAAFRRFVSRRGPCAHLWSDNGTNFVGAAKELKDLFKKSKHNITQEVAELLANDGTTWHFIPPRMPNYGGLWEAGVQSAKRHLTRINRNTKLTYEEMSTLLTQVEACLNSRPMCHLDDTNDTLTPLTPGHFLIGQPLITVPDDTYGEKNVNLLTRWQNIQKMNQDFWQRWQSEYLHTLQQRYKWQVPIPSLKIGDIVIIKDQDLPPTKWLLGRVKSLHPGADELVRIVTVQCKGNNELKRPVSKLILLPTQPEFE